MLNHRATLDGTFVVKPQRSGCVYGMTGTIDTHYFDVVKVMCDDAYNGGTMTNLYTDGVVNNIATFHKAVIPADYSNPTVAPRVRRTSAPYSAARRPIGAPKSVGAK